MTYARLAPWARSVAIAATVTSLMLAVLIIFSEESPALTAWLKATFYHHWLGKGALALILFTVTAVALRLVKRDIPHGHFHFSNAEYREEKLVAPRLSTIIMVEAIAVILSVGVIVGFFLLHGLKMI